MLSKAKIKFIKSLQIKKYRKQEQCFIVEGAKSVQELLASNFEIVMLVATKPFLPSLKSKYTFEIIEATEKDLHGLGEFQTNDAALAVARLRPNVPLSVGADEFALILDDIKDPGNLGTMIRTADWFGITKVIASQETADLYNAKVISATMGSFTRVNVYYTDLEEYLRHSKLPVFGAYLQGIDIREASFGRGGLIVIGNESKGIRPSLEQFVGHKITIPRIGKAESLNAGIAAGILCYAATQGRTWTTSVQK